MNQVTQTNQIDPTQQANTTRRQGDGSFDTELASAQNQLENKKRYSALLPWADVQKMFSLAPLEFKFEFTSNKIEDRPRDDRQAATPVGQEERHANKEAEVKAAPADASYVAITKETLKNNMPEPATTYMGAIPANLLNDPNAARFTSKADLKMVIDEIVKKIELIKTSQKAQLNMSLYQENLGEMTLLLSLQNGLVSVQIAASQPGAKKILEDNLFELESALKNARINLDGLKIVEVNHGNHPESRG